MGSNTYYIKTIKIKDELLKYISDNFVKMSSMCHLTCKEHQQYIGYIHCLEHPNTEKEAILKP